MPYQISVLGAGSWGTTLAVLLSEKGYKVKLWEFDQALSQELNQVKENLKFLPGVSIPTDILISWQLEEVVRGAEVIVIALPSHVVRQVLERMASFLSSKPVIVSGVKGIEFPSLNRISEVISQCLPKLRGRIAVLSGPSHAEEVSRRIPTAVVAASDDEEIAKFIQQVFMTPYFMVYTSLDIIGVELGGALKNIMAIAAGIADGLGFGDNTKAALITRGLAEMARLGVIKGAQKETFFGLSGLGDLVVTCTSRHSRNRHLGQAIGSGKSLSQAMSEMIMVAEGVCTTQAVYAWSKELNLDLPITQKVYEVLYEDGDCLSAVEDLMCREARAETLINLKSASED